MKKKKIFLIINKDITNSIDEIVKHKNINIVYRNYNNNYEIEFKKVLLTTKKKNIPLFVAYHQSLIKKYKVNGFYIPSFVKKKIYISEKNFLIGSAHNFREIYQKQLQGCKIIFISPLFNNNKSKKNLGIIKFNLITKNYKSSFCALGGINSSNFKKLLLTKSIGAAGINIINHLSFLRKFN